MSADANLIREVSHSVLSLGGGVRNGRMLIGRGGSVAQSCLNSLQRCVVVTFARRSLFLPNHSAGDEFEEHFQDMLMGQGTAD